MRVLGGGGGLVFNGLILRKRLSLSSWEICHTLGPWSTYTPFISPNAQSLRTELHFQFIRFAAATLLFAFTPSVGSQKRSKIEQKDIITPMHCLAFPSALFGAPFHIDNRTVANCGFWLEYASKTPLEVGADLPRRMRLFWLRCQIMRLRSVHIKLHYSQNAFDSALLAWYERGISGKCDSQDYSTWHYRSNRSVGVGHICVGSLFPSILLMLDKDFYPFHKVFCVDQSSAKS